MVTKNDYKNIISEKMKVLSDFGICDKDDYKMIERLRKAIKDKPDKDPRYVLDYYCRPMIQDVINKWF